MRSRNSGTTRFSPLPFCSTLWNSWCLFHQHIPHWETFRVSYPLSHEHLPHYTNTTPCPRIKIIPTQCQRDPLSRFQGREMFPSQVSEKTGPRPCVTALTEVLSHFALNFKQDRLPKPRYLRFDFLKILWLLKWMLSFWRIAQGGNSSLSVLRWNAISQPNYCSNTAIIINFHPFQKSCQTRQLKSLANAKLARPFPLNSPSRVRPCVSLLSTCGLARGPRVCTVRVAVIPLQ